MGSKIKAHMKKYFSQYVFVTNVLCAVSVGAFATLGVLSSLLSVPMLLGNALVFGIIYAVGKFGNDQLEDIPKLDEYERTLANAISAK